MPIERVSKGFKDISLSFVKNPLTNDIIITTNETAIARAVRNLVVTRLNEIFFDPNQGTPDLLFENIDEIVLGNINDRIKSVIALYEPRVNLIELNSELKEDNNSLNISMIYEIIGINIPTQQLSFALVSTR